MKKEVFVGLIKIIEDYKNKSGKFGEAVSKAYQDAGLEKDFACAYAYEFPYGQLFDNIVHAISEDFSDENYKAEFAEDIINWWLWECEFGKAVCKDVSPDGKLVESPMAQITLTNNKTYIVKTAAKLYDVILEDKKIANNKSKAK